MKTGKQGHQLGNSEQVSETRPTETEALLSNVVALIDVLLRLSINSWIDHILVFCTFNGRRIKNIKI